MYAHRYVVAMVSVKLLAHVNAKTAMLMLIVPMKDVLVVVEDMVNAMRLLKNACVTMVLQGKNARKKHAQINGLTKEAGSCHGELAQHRGSFALQKETEI